MDLPHPLLLVAEFLLQLATAVWVIFRKGDRPSVAIAWIAVVMAIPFAGVVAYLAFGEVYVGRKRMRRHANIRAALDRPELHIHDDPRVHDVELTATERQIAHLAESVSHSRVSSGNLVTLLGDTDLALDAMVKEIDAAKSHIHLLTYIYLADAAGDRVADALERAAKRGVRARLLVDGLGSRAFLKAPLAKRLHAAGVQVVEALPINPIRLLFQRMDIRNHRKLLVVDGRVAFTGSQNIAAKGFAPKARYAPWVDCLVRIEGPLVRELQLIFVQDWYLDTDESLEELLKSCPQINAAGVRGQAIASGPNFNNVAMTQLIQAAAQVACEELVLTTPYFVPDAATHAAIAVAARRGVQVHLVVPLRNDSRLVGLASRSHYQDLMDSGVEIHEFRDGLLHAKTITIDHSIAIVSTANLDRRSFEINFEQSVILYDADFTVQLRMLQQSYMDRSTRVSPHVWRHRRPRTRLLQNAAGLLSPLL